MRHVNLTLIKIMLTSLVFLQLASCFVIQSFGNTKSTKVYLSQKIRWELPNLNALKENFVVVQSVQATYGKDVYDMLFQVEKKSDAMAMAVMTPQTQPLMQITYKNGAVDGSVSPFVSNKESPKYMVSDFFLAFGDFDILDKKLKKIDVILTDDKNIRTLKYKGKTIVVIECYPQSCNDWPQQLTFQNIALGYQLLIKNIDYSLL